MTTIEEVGEALAEQILKPMGCRAIDHVPEDTEYPAAMVGPPRIDYDNLDDSGVIYEVDLFLFVAAQVARNQKKLYPWLAGPESVQARLQANRNLGFADVDAHATEARPTGLQEFASYRSYGAVVTVQVVIG
jgi:hypothetical protein